MEETTFRTQTQDRHTTVPDDDTDDLASFTNQQTTAMFCDFFLELEVLFADHGVCSGVIIDSLVLVRAIYEQRALVQPLPTSLQLVNRQKGAHLLLDLAVTYAFPAHTSDLAVQILDLAHVWSNRGSDFVDADDVFDLAAAVYMYNKLHLSPQQKYPRNLPELLTAFAAWDGNLTMSQYSTVSLPSSESYMQNSGCHNSWALNPQLTHGLGGRRPPALHVAAAAATGRPHEPAPTGSSCRDSLCLCASLVAPRLSRPAVSSWSVA